MVYLNSRKKRRKQTLKKKQQEGVTLDDALKEIEKKYGKGSVMKLGDMPTVSVDAISSGSIAIDSALGIGGYPKGRIIEIFGQESSGKTTACLQAIAEIQKRGERCAYIDAENALDPKYAEALGVSTADLILSQPDCGEQALDITEMLTRSGAVSLIVVDSVAALVPRVELDGSMSDQNMGLQARLMSKALRKLSGLAASTNTTIIFINQLREKIGVVFGNPMTTTGGKALRFYATIRMEISRGEAIKKSGVPCGYMMKAKIVKNKVAPPFRTAAVEVEYGKGISRSGEILDMGVECGLIEKSGSWYAYNGEKIGNGRDAAKSFIESSGLMQEIGQKVRDSVFHTAEGTEEDGEE